jgi:hypothetical protein
MNTRSLTVAALLPIVTFAAGPIQFEDATAQSGIQFTHSIGAEKLGSLCAGINRHDVKNERVLQERSSDPS